MKRYALLVLLSCAAAAAASAEPNLNGGTWQVVNPPEALKTSAGKPPPLLPAAKQAYEMRLAATKSGDRSWDGTEKCLAPGLPRLLLVQPGGFEFLRRPKQIVITYTWNHMVRVVDMDVPHGKSIGLLYEGQSVGHWDGNTLEIDTIDLIPSTTLDSSGLPHSDALHVVERYTPSSDGKTMRLVVRIEDQKTFSAPWETQFNLKHDAEGMIREDVCLQRKGIKWNGRKVGT